MTTYLKFHDIDPCYREDTDYQAVYILKDQWYVPFWPLLEFGYFYAPREVLYMMTCRINLKPTFPTFSN